MIMKRTNFKSIYFTKYPILMFSLSLFLFACNQQSDDGAFNNDVLNASSIEGVWELSDRYWVKDGDTLYPDPEEIRIHKIFLDGYVMWTSDPASDSSEWHGFGTYRLNNDTLIEKMLSMSLPMKAEMGSDQEVIFKIEYDNESFKQKTNSMLRNTVYQLIEEWKKLN